MVRSLVTMFTFPASALAEPVLLAEIVAPSKSWIVPAVMLMSPAGPVPEVATDIFPPPPNFSVGVATVIWPAAPLAEAVLKRPLLASFTKGALARPLGARPEIETEAVAVMVLAP